MPILYDCHLHTAYSGDSTADPVAQIARAKEIGLSGITITDHLDLYYKEEPHRFDLDLPSYLEGLDGLIAAHATESFSIKKGLELGLLPEATENYKEMLNDVSLDFIIGSTHVVGGVDPYYPVFFEGRAPRDAYRAYYEQIETNLHDFHAFDALGHLDYAFRYGPREEYQIDTYHDFAEIVDAILTFIIKKDIALEVNSAPLYKGGIMPNPCVEILKRYRSLGGTLLTIGADAHVSEYIAHAFDQVDALLKELGYRTYVVYEDHVPKAFPL